MANVAQPAALLNATNGVMFPSARWQRRRPWCRSIQVATAMWF